MLIYNNCICAYMCIGYDLTTRARKFKEKLFISHVNEVNMTE